MTAPAASPSLAAVLALVDALAAAAYSFGIRRGEYDPDMSTRKEMLAADRGRETEAKAALVAELRRLCEDRERWLYFRQFLRVEDDSQSGGQYLFMDDEFRGADAPGFENTVESLVDCARLTPEPAHHDG